MHTCECGYEGSTKYKLTRHQQSKAHALNMSCPATADDVGNYSCNTCNFETDHKGHYRTHMLSNRHTNVVRKVQPVQDVSMFSSLNMEGVMSMFGMLMKHQETLVKVLLADRDHALPQSSLQNVMLEKCHNQTTNQEKCHNQTTNQENSHNNTVTTNKSFNLQFFLNEECKNAMNFSDFLKTLSVTIEDIEHLGEVGYTQGMSKILTKALSETNVRPMHCTDAKRETMYVKENDKWHKDEDCEETKRLIQHIAHKNYKALKEWRENHPEHTVSDTEDYEAWYRMSRNMCNTDPSALKKLIRHLAAVTAIEKT